MRASALVCAFALAGCQALVDPDQLLVDCPNGGRQVVCAAPVAQCDAGRLDCNHTSDDGCEVDELYDRNNCGDCGRACSACAEGSCGILQPVQPAPIESVNAAQGVFAYVTRQGTSNSVVLASFSGGSTISTSVQKTGDIRAAIPLGAPTNGAAWLERVTPGSPGSQLAWSSHPISVSRAYANPVALAAAGASVWVGDAGATGSDGAIVLTDTSQSDVPVVIVDGITGLKTLVLAGGNVPFVDDKGLRRASATSPGQQASATEVLNQTVSQVRSLAYDAGKLYWIAPNGLFTCPVDPCAAPVTLVGDAFADMPRLTTSLAVVNGHVFWVEPGRMGTLRAEGGTNVVHEIATPTHHSFSGVVAQPNSIVWADTPLTALGEPASFGFLSLQ